MLCTVLCLVLCLATLAVSAPLALEEEWQQWKQQHGKAYSDEVEESIRRAVWFRTYHSIQEHNTAASHPYQLGLNKFADKTPEEFRSDYLTPGMELKLLGSANHIHKLGLNVTYPSSMDWRSKGFVTDVKDQGRCGSSWAFGAIGALEGQLYKATRTLTSLSEQQLLDCTLDYGNKGCSGGTATASYAYVQNFGGICRGSDYPYIGYVYYCGEQHCPRAATCSGCSRVPSGSESYLLDATYNVGLISVAVDASSIGFQYYTAGIYYDLECTKSNLNHAMLVVGYSSDSDTGMDYWILKNSWGEDWGSKGYMKLARNQNNMCGIATAATYPIL